MSEAALRLETTPPGALRLAEAKSARAEADAVIQATSCGMQGGPPADDLLREVSLTRCRRRTVALDLVCVPAGTPWIARARAGDLRAVARGGVELLVRQGAAGFEKCSGVAAPVAVVREAVGL